MFSRRMRGFSLIEMMVVISLILIVLAFSIMAIQPALKQTHVTQGYNTTLMAMRQARDISVAQRQIYFVTLNNAAMPNTITITQGSTGTWLRLRYCLPSDVAFDAEPGLPNSPIVAPTTPDGFGTGATAIDFDQGIAAGAKNVIYFYPDGSAADVAGQCQQWRGVHSPARIRKQFPRHHAVGRNWPAARMACLQERGKVLLEATVKAERETAFRPRPAKPRAGFSLIEVMISMVILVVGLISMLGVFGIAMAATQTSQENSTAKQLANEAIETLLTARETANVTWDQIQNTGSGGIFLPGFLPIDCPGVDGIIGTADDAACGPQIMEQPGPSGVYAGTCSAGSCVHR